MKITAIIVAAGSGRRMGADKNKVFLKLANRTVLEYTLGAFLTHSAICDIIIVTRKCDVKMCEKLVKHCQKPIKVIIGGKTRQESVLNGLKAADGTDIAVIHDGARAMVSERIITDTVNAAEKYGGAAAGVPSKDSLKTVGSDGFIAATIDRASTYLIQTPQVFDYEKILRAHTLAEAEGFSATDDCALYEKYEGKIKLVEGSYDNIKLTTPEDMIIAKNILKNSGAMGIINIRRSVKDSVKLIIQDYIVRRSSKKQRRG